MRHLYLPVVTLLIAACASAPDKKDSPPASTGAAPAAAAPQVPPAEAWRATPPTPGAQPVLVLPRIDEGALKNGMRVLVHSKKNVPLVDVRVVLRAGSSAEPPAKAGLADLTYELMLEGAGKLDGVALAEAFADLGTTLSVETGDDGASFHVAVLKRHLEPALKLLMQVLQSPRFDAKDFERRKSEALADLTRALAQPFYLAQVAATEAVFGKDHPYGHLGSGTPQTVATITLADVKKFYGQAVGPKNAALVMAGDVELAEAQALGQKILGGLKGAAKPMAAPAAPVVGARSKVIVVPKPGLAQTVAVLARPAIAAGDPSEWALVVGNNVFGGMFSSRLNLNLREDKGYTYGARGVLAVRRGVGALMAYAPVQADKTGASVQEMLAEVQGLRSKPITDAEFVMARDSELRSVPGWFETAESMTATMASLVSRDQPLDRLKKMVTAFEDMDKAAAQQAIEAQLDAGSMQIVLVGDPDLIKAQIEPLKLGGIELRPVEDVK
jgi:predicted Zn-dependent peptidase